MDYESFCNEYSDYKSTSEIFDSVRLNEYPQLDKAGHIYLDYTGGNLYSIGQIEKHFSLLKENIFGNPHSANPTSNLSTGHIEATRKAVLDFFNAGFSDGGVRFQSPGPPGGRCPLSAV